MVVRNFLGEVVASAFEKQPETMSAVLGESLVLCWAITVPLEFAFL